MMSRLLIPSRGDPMKKVVLLVLVAALGAAAVKAAKSR
jgi:hypothetical protein